MTPEEFAFRRRWQRDVEAETETARSLFRTHPDHLDNGLPRPEVWIAVMVEELGKLSRCINKLNLTTIGGDAAVKEQWRREAYRRMVTTASLVRRMAERWQDLTALHHDEFTVDREMTTKYGDTVLSNRREQA